MRRSMYTSSYSPSVLSTFDNYKGLIIYLPSTIIYMYLYTLFTSVNIMIPVALSTLYLYDPLMTMNILFYSFIILMIIVYVR